MTIEPGARRASIKWVVGLTGIGSMMAALDTVVVSTALTTIHSHLHASVGELEWTVNAYNLSFAVLMITAAALGDRFGRRAVYSAGLALFAVASAACALAPNAGSLIASRALQGAGAAAIVPLGLTLLSAAFPPEKRGAAIGMFSAVTGISVALGPLVGGAVTHGLSWQWIFWLNVPVGLIAAPLAQRRLPESFGPNVAVDVKGLGIITSAALGLTWGLVRGNSAGWASPEVLTTLVAGAVLAAAFVALELRVPNPMVPMSFFRSRAFSAGNVAIFCTMASLFSAVYFFPQLLQNGLGYDPLAAGLRLMPWTVCFITVAPIAGTLADRIGERPLMTTGLLLQATGVAWAAAIAKPGLAYTSLLAPFIVAGIGISMAIPAAQNSVVGSVSDHDLGKASGVNTMMRELGGVFGIAVAVALFAGSGHYGSRVGFTDGFGPAMAAGVAFALVGAAAATWLPPRRRPAALPIELDTMILEGEAV
ncbi:MAG TPA: MFS transporter [Acidimicrobiales bacterium]|nr:MFS transporter [Acidimicrobiales bacterium]